MTLPGQSSSVPKRWSPEPLRLVPPCDRHAHDPAAPRQGRLPLDRLVTAGTRSRTSTEAFADMTAARSLRGVLPALGGERLCGSVVVRRTGRNRPTSTRSSANARACRSGVGNSRGPERGLCPFVSDRATGVAVAPAHAVRDEAAISGVARDLTWARPRRVLRPSAPSPSRNRTIDASDGDLVLIAAVSVDPEADDAEAVYANNTEAMFQSAAGTARRFPQVEDFLLAGKDPGTPSTRTP